MSSLRLIILCFFIHSVKAGIKKAQRAKALLGCFILHFADLPNRMVSVSRCILCFDGCRLWNFPALLNFWMFFYFKKKWKKCSTTRWEGFPVIKLWLMVGGGGGGGGRGWGGGVVRKTGAAVVLFTVVSAFAATHTLTNARSTVCWTNWWLLSTCRLVGYGGWRSGGRGHRGGRWLG